MSINIFATNFITWYTCWTFTLSALISTKPFKDGILKFELLNSSDLQNEYLYTDEEKFVAIITNLVKNAIKYSDEGFINFGYHKKNDFFEFFVEDSGIGIDKSRHQAIFERFIQADISDPRALQGAGLGLTITKAYVELLGGKISVESELGGGSKFLFTIPITN